MNKKIFLILFFSVLLCFVVSSEEYNHTEIEEVDYSSELNLDYPVVGSGMEYSKTDSGAVFNFDSEDAIININGTIFENIAVVSSRDFVLFEEGKDPKKILAGEKMDSVLEVDSTGKIINANFRVNEDGGRFTINGISFFAPPNSQIIYTEEGGLVIDLDNNQNLEDIKIPEGQVVSISGVYSRLPSGDLLNNGEIMMDSDGNIFLDYRTSASLNDVTIKANNEIVFVYSDSNKHEGNYVSFSSDSFFASGSVKVDFGVNNIYAKVQDGDDFSLELDGGSIELFSNSNKEKIPEMNVFGDVVVVQNSKRIINYNSKVFFGKKDFATTSPMKISFFNSEGEDVFTFQEGSFDHGKGQTNKMLIDNFNRFAIIPEGSGEEFFVDDQGLSTKFSSKLSYNYISEEEISKIADGKLRVNTNWEGYQDLFAGRVRDYWNNIPKNIRDSVKSVHFENDWSNYFAGGNAYYSKMSDTVNFKADEFSLEYGTFRHELTHSYINQIFEEDFELAESQKKSEIISNIEKETGLNYQELKEGYQRVKGDLNKNQFEYYDFSDKLENLENKKRLASDKFTEKDQRDLEFYSSWLSDLEVRIDEYEKYLDKHFGEYREFESRIFNEMKEFDKNKPSFDSEWKSVSSGTYLGEGWGDEDPREYPKDGFLRNYGRHSPDEDHSVFSEKVKTPEFFRDLINPNSPKYHPDYRKKIDYMYKIGSISEEEYSAILNIAGVK